LGCSSVSNKEKAVRVCPRCQAPYSYVKRLRVGGRVYLYAVHYVGKGRNRKASYCYLGADGNYRYVEGLLGLNLEGLTTIDLIGVVEAAVERLAELRGRGINLSVRRLENVMEKIHELIREAKSGKHEEDVEG